MFMRTEEANRIISNYMGYVIDEYLPKGYLRLRKNGTNETITKKGYGISIDSLQDVWDKLREEPLVFTPSILGNSEGIYEVIFSPRYNIYNHCWRDCFGTSKYLSEAAALATARTIDLIWLSKKKSRH